MNVLSTRKICDNLKIFRSLITLVQIHNAKWNCVGIEMPIISELVENTEKYPWHSRVLTRYRIDPNSLHETPLPGDHRNCSFVSPESYNDYIDAIQNFKVRADDVWIIGVPKTGTTWMHNIVYKLKHGLDCENIAEKLEEQYFEKEADRGVNGPDSLDYFESQSSPRIFKSHLPAFLLPKGLWTTKPRIIYTTRNPKDTVISEYHMTLNSTFGLKYSFEEFCEIYMKDTILGTPFFEHLRTFLQLRHLDHVSFCVYEHLLNNQHEGIKQICKFLKCPHSDAQLNAIAADVSFQRMKKEFPSFWSPEDKISLPDPDYQLSR